MDSNTLRQLVWQPEESAKLDFKIELYKINEPKPTTQSDIQKWSDARDQQWAEFVKDLIALTNGNIFTATRTGYLIVGADDKLKADGTPTLRAVGNEVPTRKEILGKVNSYCQPPLPDLHIEDLEVDGVKLFVVSIPPSPYLHRLSKQLKTPKKEYSPHTVLVRQGDGERTYEASPEEQRTIEQEKQSTLLNLSSEETTKSFQEELEETDIQISQSILESPHWRIILRPLTYNKELISSREECSEIVIKSMILLSSAQWRYPREADDSHRFGSTWVEVETPDDFYRHEYWCLHQSGQFINFSRTWKGENDQKNIITHGEIIYTITAIFRFSAKLFQQEIYSRGIDITIELKNVKNFVLEVNSSYFPWQSPKAARNNYKKNWVLQSDDLSSIIDEKALEIIKWFVGCFYSGPRINVEAFKNTQREL
jgi:hypothetical protein